MTSKRKLNQIINPSLKLLLFLGLVWILYRQLGGNFDFFLELKSRFSGGHVGTFGLLLLVIALLPFNLMFESEKWLILVRQFQDHDRIKAWMGILTGSTAGLITPGRLGEYLGRLMFIDPIHNWKGAWANFICGLSQNLVNLLFGLPGLSIYLVSTINPGYTETGLLFGFSLVSGLGLLYLYYNLHWLIHLKKVLPAWSFLRALKKSLEVFVSFRKPILHRVLFFSILRYLVFVTQYFLMLLFWGVESQVMILAGISVIYMIQTLIPLPPVFGLFARSELALLLLQPYCSNPLILVSATLSLWLINLLIPSLSGWFLLSRVNILKTLGYEDH